MANMPSIQKADIDDLYLDWKNPRLGRHEIEKGLTQEALLDLMRNWSIEELAVSFLESGYWPQEALIVVREALPKSPTPVLIVIEGNRRLASLKMLKRTRSGLENSQKWKEFVEAASPEQLDQLTMVPYIEMPNRRSVQAYLGFRHVTGIKEWSPAEKAQFIAKLVEEESLTYDQVRRRIGSKTPTVRQHYVAYRLLLQMEEEVGTIDLSRVEDRFSVLYRSVRTPGIQKYLALDLNALPQKVTSPVASDRIDRLVKLTTWLFGTSKVPPVLKDSRDLDDFGKVLESDTGIAYLEKTDHPNLESAKRAAGVSQADVAENVELAASKLEDALSVVHQFKNDAMPRLKVAVRRVGGDTLQLLSIFPEIAAELLPEKK